MANHSFTQEPLFRRQRGPRILNMVYTDRKSAEARRVTENLRFQIERWVNEGGAGGEDTTPHSSEWIECDRKP